MSVRDETRTPKPAESSLRALVRLLARQAAREFLNSPPQTNDQKKSASYGEDPR